MWSGHAVTGPQDVCKARSPSDRREISPGLGLRRLARTPIASRVAVDPPNGFARKWHGRWPSRPPRLRPQRRPGQPPRRRHAPRAGDARGPAVQGHRHRPVPDPRRPAHPSSRTPATSPSTTSGCSCSSWSPGSRRPALAARKGVGELVRNRLRRIVLPLLLAVVGHQPADARPVHLPPGRPARPSRAGSGGGDVADRPAVRPVDRAELPPVVPVLPGALLRAAGRLLARAGAAARAGGRGAGRGRRRSAGCSGGGGRAGAAGRGGDPDPVDDGGLVDRDPAGVAAAPGDPGVLPRVLPVRGAAAPAPRPAAGVRPALAGSAGGRQRRGAAGDAEADRLGELAGGRGRRRTAGVAARVEGGGDVPRRAVHVADGRGADRPVPAALRRQLGRGGSTWPRRRTGATWPGSRCRWRCRCGWPSTGCRSWRSSCW